jgi:hypothetical protein
VNGAQARREALAIAANFLRNCMEAGAETFMVDGDTDRAWKSQDDASKVEKAFYRIIDDLEARSRKATT